ncbi:hypothetical protein BY996DRAFT_6490031 [Phakopsora pachyrhizi]|nr:hypothetical protein BY996DRAFT_6490031 [Phakopsora pachyrhizi]
MTSDYGNEIVSPKFSTGERDFMRVIVKDPVVREKGDDEEDNDMCQWKQNVQSIGPLVTESRAEQLELNGVFEITGQRPRRSVLWSFKKLPIEDEFPMSLKGRQSWAKALRQFQRTLPYSSTRFFDMTDSQRIGYHYLSNLKFGSTVDVVGGIFEDEWKRKEELAPIMVVVGRKS